jgi:hypothetical protein
MSAIGLRDRFADGRADGVAVGSVRLADARAWAALPAAAVAAPVTVVEACDGAAAVGALAPEVGLAVGLACAVVDPFGVPDPVEVAAPADEAAGLVVFGLDGAAPVADAWPAAGAVDWPVVPEVPEPVVPEPEVPEPVVPEPEVPELVLPEPEPALVLPALAAGVVWLVAAEVLVAAGVVLVCGLSRVLTTDPRAPVTGSVTV